MNEPRRVNIMKRFSMVLVMAVSAVTSLQAALPAPVPPFFINETPIAPPTLPPRVNAAIFINNSLFSVQSNPLFPTLVPTPWEAQSVQFWTNAGVMIGQPGLRLDYTPNPAHLTLAQRRKRGGLSPQAAAAFENSGEISVASTLTIHAKRLINSGIISGDVNARLRFFGDAGLVDLSRGAVRVGDLEQPDCVSQSNFFFGPFFFFGADPAVNYRYLSSGTAGFVNTNRTPLNLSNVFTGVPDIFTTGLTNGPRFSTPSTLIPASQYVLLQSPFPGFPATNRITNIVTDLANCGAYESFVHIRTNPFGREISVVFVPTNGSSVNVSVGVAFPTNGLFGNDPIVEFRAATPDVITQLPKTTAITFRDGGANIFRGHDCEFDLADAPNAVLTSDLFYNANFVTNLVFDYAYTVAQAHVGNTNLFSFTNQPTLFTELGRSPAASDPTNYPGRIEIAANTLDLTQARLRAENGIFIRATNLVGNEQAFLDAPFVSFDVGTTNHTLVISNMLVPTVNRVSADFNSWSGSWSVQATNGATIETLSYNVLVLGACVTAESPTIVHRFHLSGTNLVIADDLAINASLVLKGKALTIADGANLNLPRGANIAFTNLPGVVSFTNFGSLNVPNGAYFGIFEEGYVQKPQTRAQRLSKKPQPPRLVTYDNVINHGTIAAASTKARANRVESSGTLLEPAFILGSNGTVSLNGGTLVLSNTVVRAQAELRLTAGNLLAAHSDLSAGSLNGLFGSFLPGALIIDATNSLTDGGVDANNVWRVTGGVRMTRRPTAPGNLLGTRLESRSGTFVQNVHTWAGQNRGATEAGYSNNLALGRLVLDGVLLNRFRFRSTTVSNALYVDYLELRTNGVANSRAADYTGSFAIDPDFTIYFADSNLDPIALSGLGGGRIKWVSSYAGAQSGTNLLYPNGITYTFNAALVRSLDFDSDGDNVLNGLDCTPIPVPGVDTFGQLCPAPAPFAASSAKALGGAEFNLQIALAPGGGDVVLKWDAPAHSANTVEFTESLAGATWQTLTNFINGPADQPVTVRDAAGAPARVYRVRVDAGKP